MMMAIIIIIIRNENGEIEDIRNEELDYYSVSSLQAIIKGIGYPVPPATEGRRRICNLGIVRTLFIQIGE